jgi:nucleoside 2-deoxyribosyltransferase
MVTANTKKLVLVLQPFDELSDHVFALVQAAAASVGASASRVDTPTVDKSTAEAVDSAIDAATIVIADLTDGHPNVMYEYGVAKARGKPLLVIARGLRSVPSDVAQSSIFLSYGTNARDDNFSNRLATYLKPLLSDQAAVKTKSLLREKAKQHKVFVSYSHADRDFLDRLLVHLKPLERDGKLEIWSDTHLRAGDRWKREIENALARANAAVLLISADFMASEFITNNELPPLLKNAEERGTRIIPLIVKPSRFSRDGNLRQFQAANDPKEPLILLSTGRQEEIFDRVAEEVERWMSAS